MFNLSKRLVTSSKQYPKLYSFKQIRQSSQTATAKIENDTKSGINVQETSDFKSGTISTKIQKKLPQKSPLVKNFFVGQVDRELLAFPETISNEDLEKLRKDFEVSTNYFNSTLNSSDIEKTRLVPKAVLEELKELNSFGTNIPQHLGGRGYFITENCVISEIEGNDFNVAPILNSHRLVSQILLDYGTEDQKNYFLPKLANGNGFCLGLIEKIRTYPGIVSF